MILNPDKTKTLVVSRSRTVNSSHGDLVLSGGGLVWGLDWGLTTSSSSKTMCVVCWELFFFRVSQRIDILRFGESYRSGRICVTALLLCICSPDLWVLFSGVEVSYWLSPSAARAPGLFGNVTLPGLNRVSCRRSSTSCCWTVYVCSKRLIQTRITVQWASVCFYHSSTTWAAAAAHQFDFEVSRCRTSQLARCFLQAPVRMCNDIPYTVFHTVTYNGYKGAVNSWLHPWVVFFSVFRGAGACGIGKAIYNTILFFPLGPTYCF